MDGQTIRAPAKEDTRRLAEQVVVVRSIAERELGLSMSGDDSDLDVLQQILDRELLAPTQTYELQCLGIVFGRRLVNWIAGLDWCVVEDAYGTDPALRLEGSTVVLFPLTMISKRVECGEHVDVRAMFDGIRAHVEELESSADRVH
jgi:hypothetical protein